MKEPTTIIVCKKQIKSANEDIEKFSTTLTMAEAIGVIRQAELRKAEGKSLSAEVTSEQLISDLKMHRYEGGH